MSVEKWWEEKCRRKPNKRGHRKGLRKSNNFALSVIILFKNDHQEHRECKLVLFRIIKTMTMMMMMKMTVYLKLFYEFPTMTANDPVYSNLKN